MSARAFGRERPVMGKTVAAVVLCLSAVFAGACGETEKTIPGEPAHDEHVTAFARFGSFAPGMILEPLKEPCFSPRGLTVEAWVSAESHRAGNLPPLVSKWSVRESFDAFAAFDAGGTDGLTCLGYLGAVFDGRFVYFSPMTCGYRVAHGNVLRCDTHRPFGDTGSYAAYDAGSVGGMNTKGYYGAVFDGRYVYFVPRKDYVANHSRVLRYDTRGNFRRPGSWEAYDVGEAHTQQGAAFDGRYIYFAPGYRGDPNAEDEYSGRVIRFDTEAPFTDASSWSSYDAGETGGLRTVCFDGASFDGRYVYFAPLLFGAVLRYDTKGDFSRPASWSAFDASRVGMKMCVGTVFDGRYLYFAPYYNGVVVRFDTRGEFTDPASWESRDAGLTDGLKTGGYDGGFYDGRYVYFVPFVMPGEEGTMHRGRPHLFHGNFLRYDTRGSFDDPGSWRAVDASSTDGLETIGYNAGAFDGRFFYLAPWRNGNDGSLGLHGRIQRYDTVGDGGSFRLSYCDYGHNGGLSASVPGPSFVVNTDRGAVSVAAHETLPPGRHYLAGTWDGLAARLYVDGMLVAERPASGEIVESDTPLVVGGIAEGAAGFDGAVSVTCVRISDEARSGGWILAAYRSLVRPGEFVRLEHPGSGN